MSGGRAMSDFFSLADRGIGSWPARRARMTPDRKALVFGDRTWTYAELYTRTEALARSLVDSGLQPGDRVAYLGANHPAFLESMFAIGHAGAVMVPLNTRLSPVEIAYMLDDSGSGVLIYGAEMAATVEKALAEPGPVRRVIAVDAADTVAGAEDYESIVAGTRVVEPVDVPVSLDNPCMIIYTSGTTGRPKGAVITHGNVTWNVMNQLAHVDFLTDDVALAVAPLFHTAGLNQVTMPTLLKGGAVVVVPRFDPGELLATVERERIASFAGVPTILQMIVDHPAFERTDLSSLRLIIYGGSPVHERVARTWLERGVPLVQGYGMTEASPGVFMALPDGAAERPVSSGVPLFFTDVTMLTDTGEPGPAIGHAGELLVRGPNVFTGYWRRETDTAAAFVGGDWFRTGDVVRVDYDGWAYVIDRTKDMIISGGENIYPAEVEAVLRGHPAVLDCAVVGTPDERWGEVGVAFVLLRPGAELDEATLTAHMTQSLARYKVPKYVRFVDQLPTTAVGKIRRTDLRRLAHDEFGSGGP